MTEKRSGEGAQSWTQLALLPPEPGVGARHGQEPGPEGGGGYLNECTPSKTGQRRLKKIAKNFSQKPESDPREAAMLDELDAMGLSRTMLRVARTIGFDNFMAMWRILDDAHEAISENDSGIYIRLQRLSAYRRYQRNRFIEAMVRMGMSQPEIARSVKRDLGEEVSDRHIWRLMAGGRVK